MDNPASADPDAMYRRPGAAPPPTLPSISDYWPDAPHRIGPPADHYTDEPTEAAVDALRRSGNRKPVVPPILPPPRRRSRRAAVLGFVLVGVLTIGAGAVGLKLTMQRDRGPDIAAPAPADPPAQVPAEEAPAQEAPATDPPAATKPAAKKPPARSNVISAPAGDRDKARFELVSSTVTMDLKAADLGNDLYRITTPASGSVLPRAQTATAGVKLFLDTTGKRGDAAVTVLLNADVRWSLRISGGVRTGVYNLGAAKVDDVNFAGGATRIDLTLPRPEGTLPIRLSGGVNRFEVYTDQGVPVRVRTRRGAGQVKLDGRTDDGVARGALFLSPSWEASKNRIDLDAVAGIGTLRVDRG